MRRGEASVSRGGPLPRNKQLDYDPTKRWAIFLIMFVAMVCATATLASSPVSAVLRSGHLAANHPLLFFGDGQLRVRTLLFGPVFVAWGSLALFLTRAWHGVRPALRTAARAMALVTIGQTLILLAAAGSGSLAGRQTSEGSWLGTAGYIIITALFSAAAAFLVVVATRLVTRRGEPLISRSILLWGAGWVAIQQTLERRRLLASAAEAILAGAAADPTKVSLTFAPEMVLAWQLPIGLAVALWFTRTHFRRTAGLPDRTQSARWWGKATVLIATALLLMWIALMAIERNRVPVDESIIMPEVPEGFE